ncbi:MAG: aldehyde ferredoxin oxidoreductase N-terminal domain-containing protein [Spirochaetota bacterium]|nr:aldehyde ferredoxin oxidoreductase N-terminal domain-containing protein [Spirochaetota bacterium]
MRRGYAGNILSVDLSNGYITKIPTENYTDRFIGGRGMGLKTYWDDVSGNVDAFDPENRLVFATGPVCGVPGFAGSRWQICGKSPVGNQFSYCNLGGSWGVQLKFAGFDGLIVFGKAEGLVYLYIDNDRIEIRDASALQGKGAIDTREILKGELGRSVRVVAVGPAGENMVSYASFLADSDSSGGGGLGGVMGSKNLKAVAVRGEDRIDVADPESIQNLKKRVQDVKSALSLEMPSQSTEKLRKNTCYGCIDGCIRANYKSEDGQVGKFLCQPSFFYSIRAQRYYGDPKDVPFKANKLCDDYGIDSRVVETMIMWLSRCSKANIITEEEAGIPFSKIGSIEYLDTLLRKISFREGFGDILANGPHKAAEIVGNGSEKLITDYMIGTGENEVYGARLYITTGLLYAMEPRMPIQQLHEISIQAMMWAIREMGMDNYLTSDVIRAIGKRFWGSEIAADFSTYEGKALAAAKIQDRQYAKESLILCDFSWPIIHSHATEDHVGDPTLESQICRAITGKDISEEGLYEVGERVFNLQRAALIRDGRKGREDDSLDEFNYTVPLKGDFGNPSCIVPGKDGEPLSRMGMVVDRNEFEGMKDEYYEIRGWDVETGLQRREKLEALNLVEVAEGLNSVGLLA